MKENVAILVSGGLDSYIAYRLAGGEKVGIWVNFGQPYAKKEEQALDELGIKVKKIKIKDLLPEKPNVDNWIIPGRNLLLVTIAAMYGDKVWLSALDGEMHKFAREKDKTPEFYHIATGLLTLIFDIKRPETIVTTPFQRLTKTEIVALALKKKVTAAELKKTSSCYHEKDRNCGKCGTCFKRWIAMSNNGIEEKYTSTPWENDYAKKSIDGIKVALKEKDYSHYSRKRCLETKQALKRVGITI